jgi:hypothetical protein
LAAVGAEGIAALISARGDAMEGTGNVKILFVAGFGPIVRDTGESRKLYGEVLGILFKRYLRNQRSCARKVIRHGQHLSPGVDCT